MPKLLYFPSIYILGLSLSYLARIVYLIEAYTFVLDSRLTVVL